MESHIVPNSSLDVFIKNNKLLQDKSIQDRNIKDITINTMIYLKYGFKNKNVKTILNQSKNSQDIF